MDTHDRLRRAAEHIFSTGLDDSGARLGLANMKYGLAKIHLAQESLGLAPDATFIAAPDLSVTRNITRWRGGFGYGGRLTWGDGQQELMVLDVKPNYCGMLSGGLRELPTRDTLLQRAQALQAETLEVDGMPLTWDLGISNHFLSIFRVTPQDGRSWLPYAFVMHGSGGELRAENAWGDGLYWNRSKALQSRSEILETPFGPLRLLTGQAARDYMAFCQRAEVFTKKRRLLIARRLFGDIAVYGNSTHQGLVSMNEMVLGVYAMRGTETLFPIAFQARLPVYLVRGCPNLSDAVIERLGFAERARRLGVYGRLQTADFVPHGGGYTFPHLQSVTAEIELGGERYFELDFSAGAGRQIVNEVHDLPYAYRGLEVLDRVVELGLGEVVARLDPIHVFKI